MAIPNFEKSTILVVEDDEMSFLIPQSDLQAYQEWGCQGQKRQ